MIRVWLDSITFVSQHLSPRIQLIYHTDLASGKARILSGKFVNGNQNVIEVVQELEQAQPEKIKDLYRQTVQML